MRKELRHLLGHADHSEIIAARAAGPLALLAAAAAAAALADIPRLPAARDH